jgi:fatty-acyl-CoA synthase
MTVPDLMRNMARDFPDRLALVEGIADPKARRRWTYKELIAEVETLARGLLTHFQPGDKVGLLAPETPEWVIFQHALCFAGLVIVPFNPAYTEREIDYILKNAGAKGLIYAESSRGKDLRAIVSELATKVDTLKTTICTTELEAVKAAGHAGIELPELNPNDMMQIQYTSGTTGVPKGACLHHLGVINNAYKIVERANFPIGGVWINAMPLFHIGGGIVSEIGTFSRGGTFVLMQSFDPALFLELIEAEKVNNSLIVPTMILALLGHPDLSKRDVSSFNSILSGAATVPAALVERSKKAFGCQFCIMYGMTESNGPYIETLPTDSAELQSETIGIPTDHAEVRVVDIETLKTAPVNTVGEFWVRGYFIMTGYYGQAEASAATITPDGWLRTGDLGTMDENGYFRITGRLKEMIIRGGMNLYPKEIEEILFTHPGVSQAAVIGLTNETWGETVAAVVQSKDPKNPPTPDELYQHCRANLSPQKTPETWFIVEQFPLTATGKIQKNVLRKMYDDGLLTPSDWVRPTRHSAI